VKKLNSKYIIFILRLSVILFIGITIYNAYYKIQTKEYNPIAQSILNDIFYSTPVNSAAINQFVDSLQKINPDMKSWVTTPEAIQVVQNGLKDLLNYYSGIGDQIKKEFTANDIKDEFLWNISLARFRIVNKDSLAFVIDQDYKSNGLLLFGDEIKSKYVWKYSFNHFSNNYYLRLYLNFRFKNLPGVISKHILSLVFGNLLLIVMYIFIVMQITRYIKKQKQLFDLQSDFINYITHEFNTPLSAINLWGQTIKKLPDKELLNRRDELANVLLRQKENLHRLIEQFLTVSMTENSALTINKELFNAKTLFSEIINGWITANTIVNYKIIVHLDDSGYIEVDKGLIAISVHNLLDNALKYNRAEEPTILISGKRNAHYYQLSISDNGVGIPKEYQRKIFEKFYRINSDHTNKTKGVGIGLYLVKQIIQLHNAKIHLNSTVGEGSEFFILIPAIDER